MNTDPTRTTVNTELLVKRYKDGYTVATVVVSFGRALKFFGFFFGVGILTAGALIGDGATRGSNQNHLFTVYIIGSLIVGLFTWFVFYVAGVIVSCQGQVLRANLDEAVYVCPFFSEANKIIAANLPTSRNA